MNNSTVSKHIPVLDGLRFFAAFSVLLAHYTHWIINDQGISNNASIVIGELSGLGMALFFCLSGFVIHYNYHDISTIPSGRKRFLIARFTRLYPLFLVLFVTDFCSSFYYHRGSCGLAGERWGYFLALPYYLTFTQSWAYGVICNNNLIYQYHMVSAVTWSLSVEAFFYIIYVFGGGWLRRQDNVPTQVALAGLVYLIGVGCLLFIERETALIEHVGLVAFGPVATAQHGYQDSLLHWLFYFNPAINLPAFFSGAVAANIYLLRQTRPIGLQEHRSAHPLVVLSLVAVLAAHFWLYSALAPTHGFIGRTASMLYIPLVALLVYLLARYPGSFCARVIGCALLVKLGEASYSIYLLHAFFAWNARDFYYLKLNPWVLWAIAVCCILLISRCSYLWFERPVQRWLRRKML